MSSTQRAISSRMIIIRYVERGLFLIYFAYLLFQVIWIIRTESLIKAFQMPLFYDFIWFLILFAIVDALIGYFQSFLMNSIKKADETIIGTISSYNNRLTLGELATKFKMSEEDLEKIFANINMQGEYSIRIDKETRIVSVVPVVSLVGAETKEEKLQRLEELFKEGKISERTYKSLKEKYSKE
ncbi:MAG: hypothetical protein QXS66_07850 [Thermoproteota archaeon]